MISKEYGRHKLVCDVCGVVVDEEFGDFQDALDYARRNRWRLEWKRGEWENICPKCRRIHGHEDGEM